MSTKEVSPLRKGVEKTKNFEKKTTKIFSDTTKKTHKLGRDYLRYEIDPVKEEKWWKRIPYTIGNITDATIGNSFRRIQEITEPLSSTIGSLYYTTLRVPFNPINTLLHPIKYIKNALNIPVSGLQTAKNTIRVPFKGTEELIDRGVKRPIQYNMQTIDNIPKIGEPIAEITNKTANSISEIVKSPTNLIDKTSKPLDILQEKLAR